MKLLFSSRSGFPERTVAVTGPRTEYSFDLPMGYYTNVDASFAGGVAATGFLPSATALVHEIPRPLPIDLLFPLMFRADEVVFTRGVQLALPITDRAGKRFRAPRGWRSRGGRVSIDFAPAVRLAPEARIVTGISDPTRGAVTLTLAYSDAFGIRREISPPTLMLGLPISAAGTIVTRPRLRIDASPPSVRVRRLRGRSVALFIARDPQSGVSIIGSSAFVKTGRRYRPLRTDAIGVVADGDPEAKLVPKHRTGVLVKARTGRRVRLCAANGHGVQPTFSRCAGAVIGR